MGLILGGVPFLKSYVARKDSCKGWAGIYNYSPSAPPLENGKSSKIVFGYLWAENVTVKRNRGAINVFRERRLSNLKCYIIAKPGRQISQVFNQNYRYLLSVSLCCIIN